MPAFELNILGGFEVLDENGTEISIRSRKLRALVAYLALDPDRRHEREVLAGLLWGDRLDAQARQSLRQALLSLRTRFGDKASDLLDSDSQTVTWNSAACRVDVAAFEGFAAQGDLEAAVRIYRGALLAGLNVASEPFAAWLTNKRLQLNEQACDCLHRLGMRLLDAGDQEAALAAAKRVIDLDEMREPGHRLLMSAYAAAGRHAEALHHYQNFSDMLKTELGTAPDGETIRLREAIGRGESPPGANPSPTRTGDAAVGQTALDRPSIAVLPFVNMSGDRAQDYFADGISEDIITALSKSRMFFVTARGSTIGYRDSKLDVKDIARELRVRYVVKGSVRFAGEQMRITAQLIDAETDTHVWAEHYDGALRDVFSVQDEITNRIASSIQPEYLSHEIYRAQRSENRNFAAWDLFMRAYWHLSRFAKADMAECRRLCRQAIELDPKGAGHYSLIAITHAMDALYGWGKSHEQSLLYGREAALQAVGLDDHDPLAIRCLAIVDFWAGHHDDAIHAVRRALDIDPHDAENHALTGQFLGMSGNYEAAREHFERAVQLSPRDVFMATWHNNFAMVAMAARHHEEAAEWAKNCLRLNPKFPGGYRTLAAADGHLGNLTEAAGALENLRRFVPELTIARLRKRLPFKHAADLEHYLDGLRQAGLPED